MASERKGGRKATGTVAKTRDGRLQAIITLADGTRKRLKPFPVGTSEAYAKERAAVWSARALRDGIVAAAPKARARAVVTSGPASAWWDRFFKHRAELGLATSVSGVYTTHIQPVIGAAWADVTAADCERLRDTLDTRVKAGELASKTAFNAWTVFRTAAKAAAGRWAKDKRRALKVRDGDPSDGVVGPDYDADDAKQLQWLYPRELLAIASCERVALEARRRIVLATYLCVRGGELKALTWSKVDLERGVVIVDQAFDRASGTTKKTKTGNRGARRYSIEPTLLPLLRAMHRESGGVGVVVDVPEQKYWAPELRAALEAAGVKRPELFTTTATSKRVRFHDCRASGLTWMAIRGDSPVQIQHVAAHTDFAMTKKYLDAGGAVDLLPGEVVFPELPACLLGAPEPSTASAAGGNRSQESITPSPSLWNVCGGAGNRTRVREASS